MRQDTLRPQAASRSPSKAEADGMFGGQEHPPSPSKLSTPHVSPLPPLDATWLFPMPDTYTPSHSWLPSSLSPALLLLPHNPSHLPCPVQTLLPPGSPPRMPVSPPLDASHHVTHHPQTRVTITPVHGLQEGQGLSYSPSYLQEHPAPCLACLWCSTGISGRNYHYIHIVIMSGWR